MMNEKEVASLCSQIHRCYAINRRQETPFHLKMSNFEGETADNFRRSFQEHERWNMDIVQQDLGDLVTAKESELSPIVYLSADSDNVLELIDETSTYIIGGLVDRNRFKV